MKHCSICGQEKPLSEFHKRKRSLDGYHYNCKECRVLETRARYLKHKEKINAQNHEYYMRHQEETKARAREYHKENRDERNRQSAIRNRKYQPVRRTYCRKYRSLKKSQLGLWHNFEVQIEQLLYQSQQGCCFYCGEQLDWENRKNSHLDHMVPISRGGSHGIENWCLACAGCNCRKQGRTAKEFMS